MTGSKYSFKPVTEADLPLLRQWLSTPEVRKWWGDPDREIALIQKDLAENRIVNLIVLIGDRPFAYAQHYDVREWPQSHMEHLPPGSRAIDTFVGDPDMLGVGHGSAYLRQLAATLIADGAAEVVIDPDIDNRRARRAYEKAGFVSLGVFGPPEDANLVMRFDPQSN